MAVGQKAVFLDRDGVLDVDTGYISRPEQVQWVPGAKTALARLHKLGYAVFVVTNQSGIARGYYTVEDMKVLHAFMAKEIEKAGGQITHFYYCPHHPTKGTVKELVHPCSCRKPQPGMLLQAFSDYALLRGGSFLIGDRQSDIDAALAAGLPGYLFQEGNLDEFLQKILRIEANGRGLSEHPHH